MRTMSFAQDNFFKLKDRSINWCLTQTLTVFQLYRGMNKFYVSDTQKTTRNKRHMFTKQ
jgi:hypothetical protein